MIDLEKELIESVQSCSDKLSGLLVLFGLLFIIGCVALLIWSFYYDKKQAEKTEERIKKYVKEEIINAKK